LQYNQGQKDIASGGPGLRIPIRPERSQRVSEQLEKKKKKKKKKKESVGAGALLADGLIISM
jgi:hypothetical protein